MTEEPCEHYCVGGICRKKMQCVTRYVDFKTEDCPKREECEVQNEHRYLNVVGRV